MASDDFKTITLDLRGRELTFRGLDVTPIPRLSFQDGKAEVLRMHHVGPPTDPPPAPTGLTASESDNTVDLGWDGYSKFEEILYFEVYIDGNLDGTTKTPNYTKTGLNNGQQYTFDVTAVDVYRNTSAKTSINATPKDVTPPDKVTGVDILKSENHEIEADWDAPDITNNEIDGYNVYVDGTKDNGSLITSMSYVATGLTNGQSYTIEVSAVDNDGNEGPKSDPISTTVQDTQAPGQPTGLTATEQDPEIYLDWNDNSESDLAGYNVYKDNDTTPLNGSLLANSNYTVTGLTEQTDYDFYVTAVDVNGNESSKAGPVTATYDPAISAPSNLTATEGDVNITLDWDDNPESDLDYYCVYEDGNLLADNIANSTYTVDSSDGLASNSSHTFEVTAVETDGTESAKSNSVTATYDPIISAPSNLTATEGDVDVTLDWDDNSESDLDYYRVYEDGNLLADNVANSTYTVTSSDGLADNSTHTFTVTAVETDGQESNESSGVSATYNPPPAQPTGLTLTPGETTIDADWDDNSESDLAGYNVYVDGVKDNSSLITNSQYQVQGLSSETSYTIEVEAVDNAGSVSTKASDTATTIAGEVNNYSAEFDGVDDYMGLGNQSSLEGLNYITIEAWVKGMFGASALHAIISKYTSGSDRPYYLSVYQQSVRGFIQDDNDNSAIPQGSTTLNNDQWYHLALTFNGDTGNAYVYVDGIEDGSALNTNATGVGTGSSNINIGARNNGSESYFEGVIDDVRIWNTVRTQSEIQNNMNSELSGTESGLIGYWKLNEGLPLAYDKAGGNHGTVNGGVGQSTDIPFGTNNRYALDLDGSDDYVSVSEPFSDFVTPFQNQTFTFECWVKNSDTSSQSLIGEFNNKDDQGVQFLLNEDGDDNNVADNLKFYIRDSNNTFNEFIVVNNKINDGGWHHISLVWRGDLDADVYIDGVSQSFSHTDSSGLPDSWTDWEYPVAIGARNLRGTIDRYLSGYMDDVRVWNEARTQTQIQNNYQSELNGNEQGLVAYWTFDEYAEDLTANNNHGLLKGNVGYSVDVPFVQEFTSHSLDFDGTDDYVDIPSVLSSPTEVTMEGWIKSDTSSSEGRAIVQDQDTPYMAIIANSGGTAHEIRFSINVNNSDVSIYHTVDNISSWHHVCMTATEEGYLKAYVDGILVGSTNIGTPFTSILGNAFHIGTARNQSLFFDGHVDEVRVWNKALTGAEIRDSMKKDFSDLTNVVGYWKFDEGSGSTATDETGNNDGTINGATYSTDTPDS